MSEEIEKWLNDKDFILAYRFNLDIAYEVNEDLKNYVKQLQQENKELTRLIANKVVVNYDYDSILKKQLNEERLKYIALEESKNEIENTINDFEKWLDKELEVVYRDCGHKHNILQEIMYKLQELKK